MMSDALAAANIIGGDLAFYRMMDGLRAARAESNLQAQNAALQALVQRLADYARYAEQQHNSLLAEAQKIDAQRCEQINAQQDEIAALRATVDHLNAALAQQIKTSEENYGRLRQHCDFIRQGYNALAEKYGPPSQANSSSV